MAAATAADAPAKTTAGAESKWCFLCESLGSALGAEWQKRVRTACIDMSRKVAESEWIPYVCRLAAVAFAELKLDRKWTRADVLEHFEQHAHEPWFVRQKLRRQLNAMLQRLDEQHTDDELNAMSTRLDAAAAPAASAKVAEAEDALDADGPPFVSDTEQFADAAAPTSKS